MLLSFRIQMPNRNVVNYVPVHVLAGRQIFGFLGVKLETVVKTCTRYFLMLTHDCLNNFIFP